MGIDDRAFIAMDDVTISDGSCPVGKIIPYNSAIVILLGDVIFVLNLVSYVCIFLRFYSLRPMKSFRIYSNRELCFSLIEMMLNFHLFVVAGTVIGCLTHNSI